LSRSTARAGQEKPAGVNWRLKQFDGRGKGKENTKGNHGISHPEVPGLVPTFFPHIRELTRV